MSDLLHASGAGPDEGVPRTRWFQTVPPHDPGAVERPRVTALFDEAVAAGVPVIVAAPAGFGKSIAAAQWAATVPGPLAWLGLTRFDGAPDRVAAGVLAALQRALPVGEAQDRLAAAGTVEDDPGVLVDRVAHALADADEPVTLVVDHMDHVTDVAGSALAALAAKLPPKLRLVLLVRTCGDELRRSLGGVDAAILDAGDLAFDPHEVECLLRLRQRPLRGAEELCRRTDGWPVALGVELDAGDSGARDLGEYVEEEILAHLPSELVDILRATAIAPTLDPDLLGVLADAPQAEAQLARFARRTGFLDRLTQGESRRYRWRPAFRRAVLSMAERRDPAAVRKGHCRAGEHVRHCAPLAAAGHFVDARRPDLAYAVLVANWVEILQESAPGELDRACTALGDDYTDRAAILAIRACCAWVAGDRPGAELLMQRCAAVESDTHTDHATIAMARMLTTNDGEQLRAAVLEVRDALAHPSAVSHRTTPHALYALGYTAMRLRRDSVDAVSTLRSALRDAQAQRRTRLAARIAGTLAFALAFEGELTEALRWADRSRPGFVDDVWVAYDGGGAASARGFVAYWRDDLDTARAVFTEGRAIEAGPSAFEPVVLMYDGLAAAASEDRRWQEDALERLRGMPASTILGVNWQGYRDCALAELTLAHGRSADAMRFAARSLAVEDCLPVPRAMAAETFRRGGDIARARSVIAQTRPAMLTLPARVRLLVTDALLRDDAGREDAHVVIERALDLAARERILRPFAARDPQLHALLGRHATWGSRHAEFIAAALARSAASTAASLLSARELEILEYLRTPMTLSEIAGALFLSTNTIKTHVQSLYRKLGVSSRRDAVQVRR